MRGRVAIIPARNFAKKGECGGGECALSLAAVKVGGDAGEGKTKIQGVSPQLSVTTPPLRKWKRTKTKHANEHGALPKSFVCAVLTPIRCLRPSAAATQHH